MTSYVKLALCSHYNIMIVLEYKQIKGKSQFEQLEGFLICIWCKSQRVSCLSECVVVLKVCVFSAFLKLMGD